MGPPRRTHNEFTWGPLAFWTESYLFTNRPDGLYTEAIDAYPHEPDLS